LIAALSLDQGISAAMTLGGAVDGIAFKVYVQQVLAPMLRPGQIVVLDNLQVHKNQAVREMIEARGYELLFLPSYSPDFNPIEQAFSKLKTFVRKHKARTKQALRHRRYAHSHLPARRHRLVQPRWLSTSGSLKTAVS